MEHILLIQFHAQLVILDATFGHPSFATSSGELFQQTAHKRHSEPLIRSNIMATSAKITEYTLLCPCAPPAFLLEAFCCINQISPLASGTRSRTHLVHRRRSLLVALLAEPLLLASTQTISVLYELELSVAPAL
ncbi:hypothetical protein PsorP6_011629 [Peronosclerospora sorghi]|uniref:Uncharacterized protein n=1 Tax=Peronosclerospora sorghi TaxID=230839 RepID=A0ACC0WJP1_9STRA|nr:hypothetical protein PsorP6_011629 [Peronosclerospora sorghi]